MLEYTEKTCLTASASTDEDVDKLRAVGFSDEEIVEITEYICYYCFMCRWVDMLGLYIDKGRSDTMNALIDELTSRGVVPGKVSSSRYAPDN